jgi:hypothetical protein
VQALERGVSRRVVRAKVVGTTGSRRLTGPQIRAALGLRDTWFTDYRVATAAVQSRSARPASWGPQPPYLVLAGQFQPAPREHVLRVERRGADGRWQSAGRTRTSQSGHYRVTLARSGLYRVAHGAVSGPAVRVR